MTTTTSNRSIRRRRVRFAIASVALALALGACSSDDNDTSTDVNSAVTEAVADVSEAAENAADGITESADSMVGDSEANEGIAKDLAMQVKSKLDTMASPGEPLITSITDATAGIVIDPNRVTGIDDTDNDGKDDDAKFTIETDSGDDKACVQSQDGQWEVTDDEC